MDQTEQIFGIDEAQPARHPAFLTAGWDRKSCGPDRNLRPLAIHEEPALGAHLVTPRLGFAHHGIYVGGGNVVHYGALIYDLIRKPVEEVSIECFAQRRPVFVIEHVEASLDAAEVIRRVRARIGENRYKLLTNNCEHFCEWALHDQHRSYQVEIALGFPRLLREWIQASVTGFFRNSLRHLQPRRILAVARRKRGPEL